MSSASAIIDGLIDVKINLDLVQWINNINKRKAVAFSQYMKKHGVIDEKELIYGTQKYLIDAGSYHYLFLHPSKVKQIAIDEKFTKSFETGILALRTDKNALLRILLLKIMNRRKNNKSANKIK